VPDQTRTPEDVGREWHEYAAERARAARAGQLATQYERQASSPPESMQPFRKRMADRYRQIEGRHEACARLHRFHAMRLQRWHADGGAGSRPLFMTAVSERLRTDDASIALFDDKNQELVFAVSGPIARAAHDLELTHGEGPARDALHRTEPVVTAGGDMLRRWPRFGAAVTALDVRAVVAVPLLHSSRCLGALCGFAVGHRLDARAHGQANLVADALSHTVLLASEEFGSSAMAPDDITLGGSLFEDADYLSTVNQAVGIIVAQYQCATDSAFALLRARAFADDQPVTEVARQMVEDAQRSS
jgi:hypothetical protein